MVGHEVGEPIEPEARDAREHLSLVGNLVRQDEVECADAVACHHEQVLPAVVEVTHLTMGIGTKLHSRHALASFGCCHKDGRP